MRPLFLLVILASTVFAQQPLTLQVEHINLPDDKAAELLQKSMSPNANLWQMVEAWRKEGIATPVSGTLIASATSDVSTENENDSFVGGVPSFGNCTISGQVEWLYATEYDPPELPNNLKLSGKATTSDLLVSPITPTAFEQRGVGFGFNFTSSSEVKRAITINTHITQNLGTTTMGQGVARCWMPDFHNRSQKQTITPRLGQWTLLSSTEAGKNEPGMTTTTWFRLLNSTTSIPESASPDRDADLTLIAEWYSIDALSVRSMLEELTAGPDDSATYERLQELVTSGNAQNISTRMIRTRSGTPAASEVVKEMIYMTEYEPSDFSGCWPLKSKKPVAKLGVKMPTAFETRNLGPSIEIDPMIIGDSKFIQCGIDAQTVDHDIDHNMGSLEASVYMPFFISTEIKTRTFLEDGKPRLIGITSKPIRTFPAADVQQSTDIENPPKYQLNNTARTVLFLTAKVAK